MNAVDEYNRKMIMEALKVELRICLEDGFIENPYSWATGVKSALSIMGIELPPAWIVETLKEIEPKQKEWSGEYFINS